MVLTVLNSVFLTMAAGTTESVHNCCYWLFWVLKVQILNTCLSLTRKSSTFFAAPACTAVTNNDTDKNFNEKKINLQASHSFPQVSKDDRSDIESSSDEDDSPPPNQKHHSSSTNGTNKNHGTNGYLTGAPYPDEHWLSWYHDTGAMLQTPSINMYVCECVFWVYGGDMNSIACLVLEVLDRFMWMQFCYQFD